MTRQVTRSPHPRSLAVLALAAGLFAAGTAAADTDKIIVLDVKTKQLFVHSNGTSYHHVPLSALAVDLRIQADAQVAGRVKHWEASVELASERGDHIDLSDHKISKSYPWGQRPKSVDRVETLSVDSHVWQQQFRSMCNDLADELRGQGLSDAAIFSQDRKIKLSIAPRLDVTYTVPYGVEQAHAAATYDPSAAQMQLVCRKWAGASVPQASNRYTVSPAKILGHSLSIYESATLNGTCKIRLDGWVTTDVKNAEVSFRYRDGNGKESQVWTVNTGESKTATFSHWYNIPNTEWKEIGNVRMIGVSHNFESELASYVMDCVEGGPDTLVSNEPPKLTMAVVPQGKVMVHGRICPEVLKLVGVLFGQGNFSGQAAFFGPGYISPLRDYSLSHGEKVVIGAEAALDWDGVTAAAPNAPLSQARVFGFNVTNENGKVVASIAKKAYFIECQSPQLNPAVGLGGSGNLTVGSDEPTLPSSASRSIRVLRAQPETPAVRQPMLSRQRLLRPVN